MSFASRHNKGKKFDIDLTDYSYCSLKDFVADKAPEDVFQIAGLYINTKGNFKPHPVAIIPEYKVLLDLPQYMTDEVVDILANDEDIEEINNGLVGISFYEYHSDTYKKDCIGVNWEDV